MREFIRKFMFVLLCTVCTFAALTLSVNASEPVPKAPKGLHQINADISMVEVTWDEVKKADYYEVQCVKSKDGSGEKGIMSTENRFISFYKLKPGKSYYIRVRAVDLQSADPDLESETEKTEDESGETATVFGEWSKFIEVVTTPEKTAVIKQT